MISRNCRPAAGKPLANANFAVPVVDVLRFEARQNPPSSPVAAVEPPADTHFGPVGAPALGIGRDPTNWLPSRDVICRNRRPAAGKPLANANFAMPVVDVLRFEARQNPPSSPVAAVEPPADTHSGPIGALALGERRDSLSELPPLSGTRGSGEAATAASLTTAGSAEPVVDVLWSVAKQNSPAFQVAAVELSTDSHSAPNSLAPNAVFWRGEGVVPCNPAEVSKSAARAGADDTVTANTLPNNVPFFFIVFAQSMPNRGRYDTPSGRHCRSPSSARFSPNSRFVHGRRPSPNLCGDGCVKLSHGTGRAIDSRSSHHARFIGRLSEAAGQVPGHDCGFRLRSSGSLPLGAVDEVRAQEAREIRARGREPVLTKTRWLLLKRPENLTEKLEVRLADLLRYNLPTVRSYLLKEDFQFFWGYRSPYWAGCFLDRWCMRTMRSKIRPMKRVARMCGAIDR